MFSKKYFTCYSQNSTNYSCKKFETFFEADNYIPHTHRFIVIGVCTIFPEFLLPLYLRYKIIKSNLSFQLKCIS